MKVNLIALLVISLTIFIRDSTEQEYPNLYQTQFQGQYGQGDRPIHNGRNIAGRARALDIGGAAEKAVGFVSKKAKEVVKLIRCTLQCFIKFFVSNYCNRMFPCLYDCSIGQTYIAPEVEKQLKAAKLSYPKSPELRDVFKVFRCLYDCAMERPIKNWETFAAALYCVADTCICFNVFGSSM